MDDDDLKELRRDIWENTRVAKGVRTLLVAILIPLIVCSFAAMLFMLEALKARFGAWGWVVFSASLFVALWYAYRIGKEAEQEKL